MSDENKTLEELKKEAVQKAKEEAKRKLEERKKAQESAQIEEQKKALTEDLEKPIEEVQNLSVKVSQENASSEADEKAKAIAIAKEKAAAAAKAKAAALAKQKGKTVEESTSSEADEKAKAIAIAKAKAAAAAKLKAKSASSPEENELPAKPSHNQPYLDKYVRILKEHIGENCIEEAYINTLSKDVPTLVVSSEQYYQVCEFLKYNEQLAFSYVSNLHGTDYVSHLEVYVFLYSYINSQTVVVKVKVNREEAIIPSVTPLWSGANWPEREVYDLLGITFTNHPNMKRILLSDEWIGHPLRKDYEPYDVEV